MKTKEEQKKYMKEYGKKYRENHKEELRLKKKEYYNRPEIHEKTLERCKKYRDTLDKKKVSEYNKMYRKEKLDPIKELIRHREEYQRDKLKICERQRNARKKDPQRFRDNVNNSIDRHPEKLKDYYINHQKEINARRLAVRFVPLKESCEICGDKEDLQRHHWNYDKPLMVNTLCSECHKIQHIKNFNRGLK